MMATMLLPVADRDVCSDEAHKVRFRTQAQADTELQKLSTLRRAQHNTHVERRTYFCRKCGGYHLTSARYE